MICLALVIAVVVIGARIIAGLLGSIGTTLEYNGEPLPEPGAPVGARPLECPDRCFDVQHTRMLNLTRWPYEYLGTPVELTPYSADPVGDAQAQWDSAMEPIGDPDLTVISHECSAIVPTAPVIGPDDAGSASDPVWSIGTRESDSAETSLAQSLRLFTSSAEAEEHMTSLASLLKGCAADGAAFSTFSLPGLPASIGSVGWLLSLDGQFYYGADLQRGNLVVRTGIKSMNEVGEQQIYDFMVEQADQLSYIVP